MHFPGLLTNSNRAKRQCKVKQLGFANITLSVERLEDRLAPATLLVNTVADTTAADNFLSLREAILLINNEGNAQAALGRSLTTGEASQISGTFGSNDTIQFSSSLNGGTITLSGSPLDIGTAMTITGPGAGNLFISGNNQNTVFVVHPANAPVAIAGLTVEDGNAPYGGGIANFGTLTITNAAISNNSGGGIYNSGTLTVSDSVVAQNSTGGLGGGVGGGIDNFSGTLTLIGSVVTDNAASSAYGGGIFNGGLMTISSSTLEGNSADYGGAIVDSSAALGTSGWSWLIDSTIADNSASVSGGGLYGVGTSGRQWLTNSTIADNSGGGIFVNPGQWAPTLNNTIVANNGGDLTSGTFSGANDLIGDGSDLSSLTNSIQGNPLLSPLGNYGGAMPIMALLPGSPAIDAGSNSLAVDAKGNPLTTDQRGQPRIAGNAVDIGAFESQGFAITAVGGNSQNTTVGTAFAQPLTMAVTADHASDPVDGGLVSFTTPTSGASATLASATIAGGSAASTPTADGNAGAYSVSASASGISTPASFSLSNTADIDPPAAITVASGGGQNTTLNTPFASALVATATDAQGMPLRGYLVTFTAPASGAGITFPNGNSAVTNAQGQASIDLVANDTLGTYTVTASVSGVSAPANFSLANVQYSGAATGTLVVNSVADSVTASGFLTLREAILLVNNQGNALAALGRPLTPGETSQLGAFGANETIGFSSALSGDTITLGGSALTINASVTIAGLGASNLTISGNNQSTVFKVASGVTATIAGLLIEDGNAGNNYGAGGIYNAGTLTVSNATIAHNTDEVYNAGAGGGIYNEGTLTVNYSDVVDNSTGGYGGGVFDDSGTITVSNSTISANSGGGIGIDALSHATTLNVENSSIANNLGGGIVNGINDAGTVTVSNSTIADNSAGLFIYGGGGIDNAGGVVTVSGSVFSDNSAGSGSGGGIYNGTGDVFGSTGESLGVLMLTNCVFNDNSAASSGGAIFGNVSLSGCVLVQNSANLGGAIAGGGSLADCSLMDNSASNGGGGIYGGDLTLSSCSLVGNSAGDSGGGIWIQGTGTTTLSNCTLANNNAAGSGGGIYAEDPYTTGVLNTTLSNCTLVQNSAILGGGIDNTGSRSSLTLTNCTLSGNAATNGGSGGGIETYNQGQTTLNNTIVANSASGGDLDLSSGATAGFFSGANDLIGDGSDLSSFTQSLQGNPLLSPLGNYGGSTQTLGLLPGSPAINAGSNALAVGANGNSLTTDQRGQPRITGNAVDIGAFETQGFALSLTGGNYQSTSSGSAFVAPLVVAVTASDGLDPVDGAVVTFEAPSSGPSATLSASQVTLSNGSASVTATANSSPGPYAVNASVSGVNTQASFALTNLGPQSAIATASGSDQSMTVSTAAAAPLVATVTDVHGNPIPNVTVTFSGPGSGAGVTFPFGNIAVTNALGQASLDVSANTSAGSYTVSASVSGISTVAQFMLKNNPGAANAITVTSGSGQNALVNTAFAAPLVATVTDAFGNLVPNVTVTFKGPSSGAGLSFPDGNTAATNARGQASIAMDANTGSGSYTVTASVTGVNVPANFTLTNNPDAPAGITVASGGGQSAVVNTTFAAPLVASVTDRYGNPVSGVTVTFAGPTSGAGSGFPNGHTAVTNAQGQASLSVAANTIAGSYAVTASVTGPSALANFAATNEPGSPTAIVAAAGSGQSAIANTVFGGPLVAIITDAFGNPVGGVTVTFAVPGSGAAASFVGGATVVTNTQGSASVELVANGTAGAFTIAASISGVSTPANFDLANFSDTATITVTSGSGQSTPVNSVFAARLVVSVTDASGHSIPNIPVTFAGPGNGAGVSFPAGNTVLSNSQGQASIEATANANGGSYAVTASVAGIAIPASFTLTNATPPTISKQPTNQTVTSGNPVTFTATASGTPTPTVQWEISTDAGSTFSNITGATAISLTISDVTQAMSGNEFKAIFTNTDGSAATNIVSLTVQTPPAITTQPISQTAVVGSSVIFAAAASGTPPPTVQWDISTDGGAQFSPINGATSPVLTFTAAAALSGVEYEAVFTNAAGTAMTNVVTLTVPAISSIASTTANGTYNLGAEIGITIRFTEPVTLAGGNLIIALNDGGEAAIAPFSNQVSAVGTYTVAVGQNTAGLDSMMVTPTGGATIEDSKGNAVNLAIPAGQSLQNNAVIVINTAPPSINAIAPPTVADGTTLSFAVTARSGSGAPLTFSLATGAPTGAAINAETGLFTWSPSETANDAPGTYTVVVVATDTKTAQASSATVTITVGPTSTNQGSGMTARTSVAFGVTQSAEYFSNFITSAYNKYLGRSPDSNGLAYWVQLMQNGLSDEHLEAGFIGSAEYIADHGGAGAGWVQGMYINLLGRTPAPSEVQYWLSQLAAGETTAAVAYGFAASQEREAQRVQSDYQQFLGRNANSTEVSYWVNVFLNGGSNEKVVAGFVSSQEYFQEHGNNIVDWLFADFRATLNRDPDSTGYQYWLSRLQ